MSDHLKLGPELDDALLGALSRLLRERGHSGTKIDSPAPVEGRAESVHFVGLGTFNVYVNDAYDAGGAVDVGAQPEGEPSAGGTETRQAAAEALATVEAERDALRAELEALRGQQLELISDPTPPVWRTVECIDIVGAAPGGILIQPEGEFELNAIGSTEEAIYADAVLISEAMKGDLSDDADYDRAAAALLRLRNLALATHAVAEAERIRITAAIRLRAANRRAQMPACEAGGGHIDALTAKASECEAIVAWLVGGGR